MKINQTSRTSRTFVAVAALAAVLGTMPIAGAQAANMRIKQATRVAPAASSVTVGKRTPLRLGRGTRLAAKTAATKRAETVRIADFAATQQRRNEGDGLFLRGAAGSLLGFAVSIGLISIADRIGLDAAYLNSLSPNTALVASIVTKIFFGAMIMVPGALAYESGARKLEARDRAAKQ